jgi:acyl dehydratase
MDPLYLEDLEIGQSFRTDSFTIDADEMKAFAARFDPQPFHLDEAAAEKSVFHGLAASGWYTAAIAMRLIVTSGMRLGGGAVGLGGEIAWPRPTRAGDTLHVETEVLEVRRSRSKPNQGVVTLSHVTLNQKGETVYSFTAKVLAFSRPESGPGRQT